MKLNSAQRKVIEEYAAATNVGMTLSVFNEKFGNLEDMVFSLRTCSELGRADLTGISIDLLLELQSDVRAMQEAGTPISDPAGEFSNRLTAYLESLPRPYEYWVSLPSFPRWRNFSVDLAPGIKIVSQGHPEPQVENGLLGLAALARHRDLPSPSTNGVSLVFKVRGYASESPESPSAADCIALLKLVTFLLSESVLESNWQIKPVEVTILDKVSGEKIRTSIPDGLSRHVGGLHPRMDRLKVPYAVVNETTGAIVAEGLRDPSSHEDSITAFRSLIEPVTKTLLRRTDAAFRPLEAAIEWHQDAVFTEDQTIAYLAACIGLESIFGEANMTEMSKRLEDRYAFLLGKDRDDRRRLAQEYGQVLKIRGNLVHARQKRLSRRDYQSLVVARRMLRDSILHELKRI